MTLSKVGYVNLFKFVVSKISQDHDKGIVRELTGSARGIRVPVKDVRSAGDVEGGGDSDSRASKEKVGTIEILSGSKYPRCNGIEAISRISVPLKLSLTADKREQFDT